MASRRKTLLLENLGKLSDDLSSARTTVLQMKTKLSDGSADKKNVAVSCLQLHALLDDFFKELTVLGNPCDRQTSSSPSAFSHRSTTAIQVSAIHEMLVEFDDRLSRVEAMCNSLSAENSDLVKLRKVLNSLHLAAHRKKEPQDQVPHPQLQNGRIQQGATWDGGLAEEVPDSDSKRIPTARHSQRQTSQKLEGQDSDGPLHPGVMCKGCIGPVIGYRFKCPVCPDYDLCNKCHLLGIHIMHPMWWVKNPLDLQRVHISSVTGLDDLPEQDKAVHEGIRCQASCQDGFIFGIRYKCCNCPTFDLCLVCAKNEGVHIQNHMFYKIPKPLQEVSVTNREEQRHNCDDNS